MSALAMILTAAMTVPGDGSEKVSGEIAHPQRLDLSGEWEGTIRSKQGEEGGVRIDPKWVFFDYIDNKIGYRQNTIGWLTKNFVDEGNGKLRFTGGLGLYRQEKDRLFICIGDAKSRPLAIGKEYGSLLILHRVKSCK